MVFPIFIRAAARSWNTSCAIEWRANKLMKWAYMIFWTWLLQRKVSTMSGVLIFALLKTPSHPLPSSQSLMTFNNAISIYTGPIIKTKFLNLLGYFHWTYFANAWTGWSAVMTGSWWLFIVDTNFTTKIVQCFTIPSEFAESSKSGSNSLMRLCCVEISFLE